MSLETVVSELTGTHAEVLAQVKARMTTQVGRLAGAELGGVLLGFGVGLISFVTDKAAATGTSSLIRDICIGMTDRFKPDGEIDFSNPANEALIDAFLADSEVAALLATGSIPAGYVKDAILAKASTAQLEFPNVTLRDIIAIREPTLAQTTQSPYRRVYGLADTFELSIEALPEPCTLTAELSMDLQVWRPVAVVGLENISAEAVYPFSLSLSPVPPLNGTPYIRVICPYNVVMGLN